MATHDSNTINKFADNTTVVGLITDETAYREEDRDLTVWCQDNTLSINVSKTKAPINIDWTVVEWVESFKFLNVHFTN